jgi:hypothetical protein
MHAPLETLIAKLSPMSKVIYDSMVAHTEGCTETHPDGAVFADIYLANAKPAGMRPHVFAGHLSALKEAGLYETYDDDCFGIVRTN